jgi:hypothetical protein
LARGFRRCRCFEEIGYAARVGHELCVLTEDVACRIQGGAELLRAVPSPLVFPAGALGRPRSFPVLKGGVPLSQYGPQRIVQHGHGEDAEAVLAAGLGFRDIGAVAAQDVAGRGD